MFGNIRKYVTDYSRKGFERSREVEVRRQERTRKGSDVSGAKKNRSEAAGRVHSTFFEKVFLGHGHGKIITEEAWHMDYREDTGVGRREGSKVVVRAVLEKGTPSCS